MLKSFTREPYKCPNCGEKHTPDFEKNNNTTKFNGQLIVRDFCHSCQTDVYFYTDSWTPERRIEYKNARKQFIKSLGKENEDDEKDNLENIFGLETVELDPLITWLRIRKITRKFTRQTEESEKLFEEYSNYSCPPILEEDEKIIEKYKTQYTDLRKARLERNAKAKAIIKKTQDVIGKVALWTLGVLAALAVILFIAYLIYLRVAAFSVSDPETGVSITIDGNDFPMFDKQKIEISAKEMTSESPEYSVATSLLHKASSKFKIYDIYLTKSDDEIQPRDSITVTIPIDSSFRKENVAIYYIAPNGSCEEIPCSISAIKGTVTFETNHFSLYAIVEKPYKVIFNTDGGSTIAPQQAIWGDKLTRPENPVKKGYTFIKWVNSKDNAEWDFEANTITQNEEIRAIWSANSYIVNFDPNGGNLNKENRQTVVYDQHFSLPTPVRKGHTFVGWYMNDEEVSSGVWNKDSNVTLKAEWIANLYSLTFYTAEGIKDEENSVKFGSSYNIEYEPSREGFTFTGWYKEPECINKVTSIVMPDKDVSLYAGWQANIYTLSFDARGGEMRITSMDVAYGSDFTLPIPTKDGYDFVCWTYNSKEFTDGSWSYTKNISLVAKWEVKKYTITFDAQGGGGIEANKQLTFGSPFTLPVPTKKGFDFIGWYYNDTEFTDGIWSIEDDITLVAKWKAREYSVSFDSNGGDAINSTKKIAFGSVYTLPTPTRTNYDFCGWTYDGKNVPLCSLWSIDENVTLTAEWKAKEYAVTFDANGGTLSESSLKIAYGTAYTLPIPTKKGHEFVGWFNNGTEFSDGIWTLGSNVSLKAEWKAKEYTISFNVGEDCGINTTLKVTYGKKYSLPTPVKEHYSFVAWIYNGSVLFDGIWNIDDNITLDAKWDAKTYSITWDLNGGEFTDSYPATYKYGVGLPADQFPTLLNDDMILMGWLNVTNGNNDILQEISNKTSGDIVLKATWFDNTPVVMNDVWEYSLTIDAQSKVVKKETSAITITVPEELKQYAESGRLGVNISARFTAGVRSEGNATGSAYIYLIANNTEKFVCEKSMKGGGYSNWGTVCYKGEWGYKSANASMSIMFGNSETISIGYKYYMSSDRTNNNIVTDLEYKCVSLSYSFYIIND